MIGGRGRDVAWFSIITECVFIIHIFIYRVYDTSLRYGDVGKVAIVYYLHCWVYKWSVHRRGRWHLIKRRSEQAFEIVYPNKVQYLFQTKTFVDGLNINRSRIKCVDIHRTAQHYGCYTPGGRSADRATVFSRYKARSEIADLKTWYEVLDSKSINRIRNVIGCW